MAVDVVQPGVAHGLRRVGRLQGGEDAFDAAELRERVDGVGAQGVDEAVLVGL